MESLNSKDYFFSSTRDLHWVKDSNDHTLALYFNNDTNIKILLLGLCTNISTNAVT